jgi:peroxiredoxin
LTVRPPTGPQDPAELDTRHKRAAHGGLWRSERRLLLIVLIVLLVLVVGMPAGTWLLRDRGQGAPTGSAPDAGAAVMPQIYPAGTAAPALRLPALDGGTLELARYRGRPVLVNFWATWCAPCVREFPLLRRTMEEHRADGLVVLGVLVNDSPERARAFVREHGGVWPVGVDPHAAPGAARADPGSLRLGAARARMLQATGGELRGAVGSDQQDRDPVLAAGRRHLAGQRLAAEPHQLLVAERVAVLLSLAVGGPLVGQRVREGGGGVAVVQDEPGAVALRQLDRGAGDVEAR